MDEYDRGRTNAGSIDRASLSHSTADWAPDDLAPEVSRVSQPPPRSPAKRRVATYAAVLAVVALLAGGFIYQHRYATQQTPSDAPSPAIPVTIAVATTQDAPTYQRAVGTVQAYNTVTVSSRVDGQIVGVGFIEGQDVTPGDPLFEIDPAPFKAALAQATAMLHKDTAQLVSAQADLQRYAALVPEGFQTRQSYDQQIAQVGQLRASIEADHAQIDAAQLNLDYATIRSPIGGRTGARLVDLGNMVRAAAGGGLVTIAQLRPIFVNFTVPQQVLRMVKQNQTIAPLRVLAYSQDDQEKLAEGTLTLIDNQIDPTTGTVHLKATFPNDDDMLWPGQFVTAHLVLATVRAAVTVPAQAIHQGPNGYYLYVVRAGDTAELRPVDAVTTEADTAVVGKGLAAGERIVVEGQSRLANGSRVTYPGQAPAVSGQPPAVRGAPR
jgi:membrane fusion protein, multidrug efflux system